MLTERGPIDIPDLLLVCREVFIESRLPLYIAAFRILGVGVAVALNDVAQLDFTNLLGRLERLVCSGFDVHWV